MLVAWSVTGEVVRIKSIQVLFSVVLGVACFPSLASDDLEAWLESDDDAGAEMVNEGELAFLGDAQDRRVLQTRNWLSVTRDSMQTGWVGLHQCQSNLDPVSSVEVVYRYHGLRDLQVVSSQHIARAQVEGNSIQLEDVTEGGEVCIRAEVQVLRSNGAGGYSLQSGPFHRRFLDGFYPVHLDYRIRWPAEELQLVSVQPGAQPGFRVDEKRGELLIDSLFEGKLTIKVGFSEAGERL
jgi:hypothetical protein